MFNHVNHKSFEDIKDFNHLKCVSVPYFNNYLKFLLRFMLFSNDRINVFFYIIIYIAIDTVAILQIFGICLLAVYDILIYSSFIIKLV